MNLNLREIQYVLTIAEEQSITKAANKLFVSQPSLSQSLKKVENEFGKPFFIRTPSKLFLTKAGALFIESGREILARYAQMKDAIDQSGSQISDTVRFGLPFFLSTFLYPQVVSNYHRFFPDNNLILSEAPAIELEAQLNAKEIDMAVFPEPITCKELKYEPLFTSDMVLIMGKDDPLNRCAQADPRHPGESFIDLRLAKDREFLLGSPGQRIRHITEIIFEKAGISPKTSFCSRSINTIRLIAADGNGLAIIPLYYLEHLQPNDNIRYYHLEPEYAYTWTLVLAQRSGTLSPSLEGLRSIVLDLYKNK